MLIKSDETKLHEHFYIFPFKCDECGNWFMLEHGLIQKNDYYDCGDWFIYGYKKYKKYCDICSREIVKSNDKG